MHEGYLSVGKNVFSTLLAISSEEQSRGLMYQKPPTPIMSFCYSSPQINKFWMQNTPSPLDIIFCHNGKVSQICYGEPYSTRVIGDDQLSDLVIEMPFGTVDQHQIKIGQAIQILHPSIADLKKLISKNSFNF